MTGLTCPLCQRLNAPETAAWMRRNSRAAAGSSSCGCSRGDRPAVPASRPALRQRMLAATGGRTSARADRPWDPEVEDLVSPPGMTRLLRRGARILAAPEVLRRGRAAVYLPQTDAQSYRGNARPARSGRRVAEVSALRESGVLAGSNRVCHPQAGTVERDEMFRGCEPGRPDEGAHEHGDDGVLRPVGVVFREQADALGQRLLGGLLRTVYRTRLPQPLPT